ncbi:unnamed protein product [Absidia cylindrospora]
MVEHKNSVDGINTVLTCPPLLDYPDSGKLQVLTTDASSRGLGSKITASSKQDLENGLVMVPTLGGHGHVEVKGAFTSDPGGTALGVKVNEVDGELAGIDDGELRALLDKNKNRFVEVSGHGLVSNAVHDIDLKTGSGSWSYSTLYRNLDFSYFFLSRRNQTICAWWWITES